MRSSISKTNNNKMTKKGHQTVTDIVAHVLILLTRIHVLTIKQSQLSNSHNSLQSNSRNCLESSGHNLLQCNSQNCSQSNTPNCLQSVTTLYNSHHNSLQSSSLGKPVLFFSSSSSAPGRTCLHPMVTTWCNPMLLAVKPVLSFQSSLAPEPTTTHA